MIINNISYIHFPRNMALLKDIYEKQAKSTKKPKNFQKFGKIPKYYLYHFGQNVADFQFNNLHFFFL